MNPAILLAVVLAGTPFKPTKRQCDANVGQCNCFAISQVEYKSCKHDSRDLPRTKRETALARCETDRVRRESACRQIPPPPNNR